MSLHPHSRSPDVRRTAGRALLAFLVLLSPACASGELELPPPRGLVIHSGARIAPTEDRMADIHAWVSEQVDSIQLDPSFMIYTTPQEGPAYPWETLEVNERGDTARIHVQATSGASSAYMVYAHYHLMAAQERLDRWLPEAVGGSEFDVERAILSRVADTWLHQRSLFDARPYGLMDELMYAKENDFLDAFILTARPDAFVDARKAWLAEHPNEGERYVDWFRRTFQREPPGLRGAAASR